MFTCPSVDLAGSILIADERVVLMAAVSHLNAECSSTFRHDDCAMLEWLKWTTVDILI